MVAVVDDGHSRRVAVHTLQLGNALQNHASGDISGTDNGQYLVKVRDAGVGGKIVQDEAYRDVQTVGGIVVRFIAEDVQGLGVKQVCQPVHGAVGIADAEKHGGLFPAQPGKADFVRVVEHGPGPRIVQRGQLFRQEHEHAGVGTVGLFAVPANRVAARGEGVRVQDGKLVHQLREPARANLPGEAYHGVHGVLLFRQALQHIANDALQVNPGGKLPERVPGRLDGDKGGGDSHNVLFVVAVGLGVQTDVVQGVVAAGRASAKVKGEHLIAILTKYGLGLGPQAVLGVSHDKALAALQDVGQHVPPGLARSAGADNQVVVVQPRGVGVIVCEAVLGQDSIAHGFHLTFLPRCSQPGRSRQPPGR